MNGGVKGKKILVTGAGSGIGASIALALGHHGAKVGVHYSSSKKKAEQVAAGIRESGGEAKIFKADFLEPGAPEDLTRSFAEEFGGVDGLVNNAGGVFGYGHFSELDHTDWENTYTLNAKAPFFLIKEVFEEMKKSGGGRIINISTVSAKYGGSANNIHYASSKAALDAMTAGFARAGAPFNILVNSIRCGVIDSGMHNKVEGYSETRFKKRINMIPLKRAGRPEDVALMALHLISDAGNFITGEFITIAGGD
ncbi:MAG TPA: SDR family oxidoreductase [Nitrospirae bacterium]|mgnify:CR=1 FL=1|nr:SDR family oxidoreductase [Nitrospirota bacterium]